MTNKLVFIFKLGMVEHAYNPSIQEVEAGKLKVQSQPGLHIQTLSQKTKPNATTKSFLKKHSYANNCVRLWRRI
jgi:hypothetical protein